MKPLSEFVYEIETFIVAHRGSSATAPENTIASISEAIKAGANMVEIDVQFTKDFKPVVIHDFYLGRTAGGDGLIAEKNYSEISTLDVGSWFDSRFGSERIPLLQDVLELIKDKIYLNIEIKSYNRNDDFIRIQSVVDLLRRYDCLPYTLMSSFDHPLLLNMKKQFPEVHTAAIKIPNSEKLPSTLARETGCEGFVCSISEINREIAEDARRNNIFIGVYPVDTIEQLRQVMNFGIKAIVTNDPGKIKEALRGF